MSATAGVQEREGLLYPKLRLPACKGLSIFKTYGLVFRLTRLSGDVVRHGGIRGTRFTFRKFRQRGNSRNVSQFLFA